MRHGGIGTLFFPGGRAFGEVDYVIDEVSQTATALGHISGHLTPVGPSTPFPFWELSEPNMYGALRLDDGRWWLCNIEADGTASNYGGIRPSGPQPKPE